MVETPGDGEQAKGGERQEVARALSTTDGRFSALPLELRAKPLVLPMRRLRTGIFLQSLLYSQASKIFKIFNRHF